MRLMDTLALLPELGAGKALVKDNGKDRLPVPDRAHMGYAWQALHKGFRGHKYQGPNKEKALTKLKKLYKSKGIKTPTEKKVAADSISNPSYFGPNTDMGPSRSLDPA